MVAEQKNGTRLKIGRSLLAFALLAVIFVVWVDLKPRISPDFFFGSEDPAAREAARIGQLFPSEDFMILSVAGSNIYSRPYFKSIEKLSEKLEFLPGTNRLISLSNGPQTVEDARTSPFWKPLLINREETASSIILFVSGKDSSVLVARAEEIAKEFENKDGIRAIDITGMPYIAEQIRRSLVQDAKIFSSLALVLFILLIAGYYRSPMIALGSCISGLSAIFVTLMVLQLIGQSVGILTANLAIIVYILVQSQIIYLCNNWLREKAEEDAAISVRHAVRKTVMPSLWCGATTLMGFMSLLFVSAEPLRQLGAGGSVAVIAAFLCCSGLFPSFLLLSKQREKKRREQKNRPRAAAFVSVIGAASVILALILAVPGLFKLQTDPSLFSYFSEEGDIRKGLDVIDQNGGSSPLQLVVSLKSGDQLDQKDAYEKLWALHKDLEAYDQVGTVLSLPALLAEANQHPLAFLLPWSEIVTLLSLDINQGVVENFLTDDRKQALFLLRMKEEGRDKPRLVVLADINAMAEKNGFRTDLTGGVYFLQGQLAALVSESLISGLATLLVLFLGIAWFATRRGRLAAAMVLSAAVIPLICLGSVGQLQVPLDIISAPAISVSLGLAVDALIHLGLAVRRKAKSGAVKEIWKQAIAEQGGGILVSGGVIALGFLIFSLSGFPPTVRFGMMIVSGAILSVFVSLALFPLLSRFVLRE